MLVLRFCNAENITVVSQPPVNTKTGITQSRFQTVIMKELCSRKMGALYKKPGEDFIKIDSTVTEALCRCIPQSKNKTSFSVVCLAATLSVSVFCQNIDQPADVRNWVRAMQQFCEIYLYLRQTLNSPGLSPASAFGGQSLFISRTSFRSTV